MGDFNLDLFHYDQHAFIQELMDSLFSYMFIPLINRPSYSVNFTLGNTN